MIPMATHQQFKIYITEIDYDDHGGYPQHYRNISPTRQEAEQDANDFISENPSCVEAVIKRAPVLVYNSPKRAFIDGLKQGMNLIDINSVPDGPPETLAHWTNKTGWLIKDERATSRRPTISQEEC